MKTKLVIFDCDGTLVDTETLSAVSFTNILKRDYGIVITPEAFRHEFMGVSIRYIVQILSKRHGVALDFETVKNAYAAEMARDIDTHMQVLPESVMYVKGLAPRIKIAIGSNGVRAMVLQEVASAGYGPVLPDAQVFTASQVAHPKPHPDLFLYAANQMGVKPEECVVVEDSAAGTQAGIAAGMRVVGYTGFAHHPEVQAQILEKEGCFAVIHRLSDLESLVF